MYPLFHFICGYNSTFIFYAEKDITIYWLKAIEKGYDFAYRYT